MKEELKDYYIVSNFDGMHRFHAVEAKNEFDAVENFANTLIGRDDVNLLKEPCILDVYVPVRKISVSANEQTGRIISTVIG